MLWMLTVFLTRLRYFSEKDAGGYMWISEMTYLCWIYMRDQFVFVYFVLSIKYV